MEVLDSHPDPEHWKRELKKKKKLQKLSGENSTRKKETSSKLTSARI